MTDYSALDIKSGAELERFDLGTVQINRTAYQVLTGYEVGNAAGEHICFWCGGELKGKLKRYCRGHMTQYYGHFDWATAAAWARRRADFHCEHCGASDRDLAGAKDGYGGLRTAFEVHHIVPLLGERRQFTAYNLPWNLIVLDHACHVELHAAMRPPKLKPPPPQSADQRVRDGQQAMELGI